jgi:hypothetical protein
MAAAKGTARGAIKKAVTNKPTVGKRGTGKGIVEKRTGERYASKAAMMKHEKSESAADRKREYGSSKKGMK